jgi:saccharopine dehydrogenase (NADP+, L-glutamate forming)
MKHILVVGAGQSAPFLIRYLLESAEAHDWFVNVGDIDLELAQSRVGDHPRGAAFRFDVNDATLRHNAIQKADIVVSMLAPMFHHLVALDCVEFGKNLVTASYRTEEIRALEKDALRKDVLILNEMGMDPGIDHMSAMALIRRVHDAGGQITAFRSYGSGIPSPADRDDNPLGYAITWNPGNVVIAGQYGAQYMDNGKIKIIPHHEVFHHTWSTQVPDVGMLEAYPNRDSLAYMKLFGLDDVRTMIRGTLRYPGWSETWAQIVRLGITNDTIGIPDIRKRTYAEVVRMFLPLTVADGSGAELRAARWLGISPTGTIMDNLRWLGLFDETLVECRGETAAAMMTSVLERKLPLKPGKRDMVILQHDIDVVYAGDVDRSERVVSTMIEYGEPNGLTAMSKTVGLPAAIGVKLILEGKIELTGTVIPTHPSIYEPVLAELAQNGIVFKESSRTGLSLVDKSDDRK